MDEYNFFYGLFTGTSLFVQLIVAALLIISLWIIYQKANKPGWAVIIPIYNVLVYLEIVKKPWWWLFLMMIPVVNIVIAILITHQLSLSFGKGAGFTIGLLFLPFIFYPILAFGDAKYQELNNDNKLENI
jgi:hypothetical protein